MSELELMTFCSIAVCGACLIPSLLHSIYHHIRHRLFAHRLLTPLQDLKHHDLRSESNTDEDGDQEPGSSVHADGSAPPGKHSDIEARAGKASGHEESHEAEKRGLELLSRSGSKIHINKVAVTLMEIENLPIDVYERLVVVIGL